MGVRFETYPLSLTPYHLNMRIIQSIAQMQKLSVALKRRGKTIGFVPTMGALHEGHLSLIQQARKENKVVVVSIFVNPIQFGPQEDFKNYPRPFKQDVLLCKKEKVDFLFLPQARQMYPQGFKTMVEVADLGNTLCGAFRPGHFRGVTTVVAKLFNITGPDTAYFGQKDAQQAVIIQRMASDLNFALKIKVMPTVREKGGLALSSRNKYLNSREKEGSLILFRSLNLARDLIGRGERECREIIRRMKALINSQGNARIDYVDIVDPENLKPLEKIQKKCLIALAVRFGSTRLIDNIVISRRRKTGDGSYFLKK